MNHEHQSKGKTIMNETENRKDPNPILAQMQEPVTRQQFVRNFSKVIAGTFLGAAFFSTLSGCPSYSDHSNYSRYSVYAAYSKYCNGDCHNYTSTTTSYCNYYDYCDYGCTLC